MRGRVARMWATATALCLAAGLAGCSRGEESGLKTAQISINGTTLRVELARTETERCRGLQERKTLPEESGMLFIFEQPQALRFWMDKTLVPLSIGFADGQGVIRQIEDMEPMTRTTHNSAEGMMYALEVNRGWFAKHGIKVGDRMDLSQVQGKAKVQ